MAVYRRSRCFFDKRICGDGYQRAGERFLERLAAGIGGIRHREQSDE